MTLTTRIKSLWAKVTQSQLFPLIYLSAILLIATVMERLQLIN
jgi:hypothetical protein